ncbi:hypothetical protein GpartN1_g4822.t1 [Galdieria partita]|uniref:Uncharacterized protein n=1 Tax=Galdieria partita TaxID=83374 RepID=A0A9C7URP8_9RHOD|nr:hypothetical protein GpartN1_g4822.t1 [Galdieria partita]
MCSEQGEEDSFPNDATLTISWHKEPVYAVDCHPQLDNIFLTASGDGTACLWKMQDESDAQPYYAVEEREDSQSLAKFSPNGSLFATACLDGSVQVFNASEGCLISDLVGPTSSVEFLRWSQDSSLLFAGCSDQTAWIWSMSEGNPVNVFTTNAPVTSGCLCKHDEYAVLGMEDGNISIFQTLETPPTALQVITAPVLGQAVICMECDPFEERLVASGAINGQILFIQPESGRILARPKLHNDSVESLDFSHQYRWLASGSTDATISVWDMERSIPRYQWQHEGAVVKVKWLKGGQLLLSGSADHTLRLWDIRTASCVKVFHGHSDTVLDFAITNNEEYIITGCDDHEIRVFPLVL